MAALGSVLNVFVFFCLPGMEENEEQKFEDMDLNDLSLWLVERDIPLEFCNALKGQ